MKDKTDFKWILIVTILAFIISILMTLCATIALNGVILLVAIIITLLFIILGIIFDTALAFAVIWSVFNEDKFIALEDKLITMFKRSK